MTRKKKHPVQRKQGTKGQNNNFPVPTSDQRNGRALK